MDSRHCGYCKQYVDRDAGPHIHDPKICAGCHQSLPASAFPLHPSSSDGRRLSCAACASALRATQQVKQKEARAANNDAERAKLREHGYKWTRRPGAGDTWKWALLDPSGAEVSKGDALNTVYETEQRNSEYPDDY